MIVSVIQSNYLPWKGYFDIIAASDLFIFYDDVEYSSGTWRNRNRIRGRDGRKFWLTVPVSYRSGDRICDVRIVPDGGRWRDKHWKSLEQSYSDREGWGRLAKWLKEVYVFPWVRLTCLNQSVTADLCADMGIRTPLVDVQNIVGQRGGPWRVYSDHWPNKRKTARLLGLLKEVGATEYITGPAGMNYFTKDDFEREGIRLRVWDYGGQEQVSVVDWMARANGSYRGHTTSASPQ